MTILPRPGILDIEAYRGGESDVPGANRVIRLASNENPLGASPAAMAAYGALRDELHRYPDGSAAELRRTIGEAQGLDPARIVCGAGSDELIALLVRAYAGSGDEVLHSEHGFLMYAIAARTAGATPIAALEANLTVDVEALLVRVTPRTRLLFIANPNNPTGTYLSRQALQNLRQRLPENILLVIDAAYAEYVDADDYSNGAELVGRGDNVVMLRTFSKIHGLAALRLGWAYCPSEVAAVLNRVRGPFNVSQAALAAGVAAIRDGVHQNRSAAHNRRWRDWFAGKVSAVGLTACPSAGNFLLVRFPQGPEAAAQAIDRLKARGILVRGMTAYGLADGLRVTIGTEEEMKITAVAFEELFG